MMQQQVLSTQINVPSNSFVTPIAFDVLVGATSTTIYTGKTDRYFLVRSLSVHNPTAGAITFALTVNGNQWATDSIAAGATQQYSFMSGHLVNVGEDIAATGNGLRVMGWGLRVSGGDTWAL